MSLPEFYIVYEGDGCETYLWADDALLVPSETLDDERKEQLEEGDTEKVFKHGGPFPCIRLSVLLDTLEKAGLLETLIEECRETAQEIAQEDDDGS